ncbi:MAG TPA: glycosyltransferase family 4 protein [Candidatus Angelobacter sp.]|nr:glycosyltransferase family 4 protein [Candidatus Angelobacter sp.]
MAKTEPRPLQWHLITCEFPPQIGGVGDYSFVIAKELARSGDEVHVWCGSVAGDAPECPGVSVHRVMGGFSLRDLWHAGKLMDEFPGPRRLFVQWVPHGYGYRAMNIFFCLWIWLRARMKHDQVQIMFHEVWLSFGINWKANIAAAAHRVMIALLKRAAEKIWISGEAWRKFLPGAAAPIGWLPVPSNITPETSPERIREVRARCQAGSAQLIGHFGIGNLLVENLLHAAVPAILRASPSALFLLIGKGGEKLAMEMHRRYPDLSQRVFFTGVLPSTEISACIAACDLLIQPYADGISTRRTAAMAVLASGRPLLTTSGHSTEPFWRESGKLAIVPAQDTEAFTARAIELLKNKSERERMACAGKELYRAVFDVAVSTQILRGEREPWTAERLTHSMAELIPATHLTETA